MTLPDWLTVEQAADYIGRSLSTVRRAIPGAPAGTVRRVQGKVYLKRDYLRERYNVTERNESAADASTDLRQYILSLEQDNAAKTQIIAQLTETNRQLSNANTALLLARNPQPQPQPVPDVARPGTDWMTVVTVALVVASLVVILWLVIG